MKIDYRKQEKELYQPSSKEPSIVRIPELPFVMFDGEGNPNTSPRFQTAMEVLYGISYGIRMSHKSDNVPEGYFEYVVPPLEGLWDIKDGIMYDPKDKENLVWTLMIRQPSFVDFELFSTVRERVKAKKKTPAIDEARFETWEEGLCCQMMHIGPYDDEPATFSQMAEWLESRPYERDELTHHEIYLGDARKTAPEKLKTVLRYRIQSTR